MAHPKFESKTIFGTKLQIEERIIYITEKSVGVQLIMYHLKILPELRLTQPKNGIELCTTPYIHYNFTINHCFDSYRLYGLSLKMANKVTTSPNMKQWRANTP